MSSCRVAFDLLRNFGSFKGDKSFITFSALRTSDIRRGVSANRSSCFPPFLVTSPMCAHRTIIRA